MAELKWLQGQIPANDWEKLNDRRKKLGLKWPQVLQDACTLYLDKVEAGEIVVQVVEAPQPEPKQKSEANVKKAKKGDNAKAYKGTKKAKESKDAGQPLDVAPTAADIAELADITG